MDWLRFLTTPPTTPAGVDPAPSEPDSGVHYDTTWARSRPAKLVRTVGVYAFHKPANWAYGRPKVIGADRLDDVEGPVVFVANHHSHADTSLLMATIPHHLRTNLVVAAGADYFFPNQVAAAASALFIGAIPIERHRLSKLSISRAVEVVNDGFSLLVYPEGGRSADGWGQDHKPGAAFVAARAGVPIVPVFLDGTGRVLPKGQTWPSRDRMAVVFGAPLHQADGESVRDWAARVQAEIDLLATEYTDGWWAARRKRADDEIEPLAGPEVAAWRRRWAAGADGAARATRSADPKRWPH